MKTIIIIDVATKVMGMRMIISYTIFRTIPLLIFIYLFWWCIILCIRIKKWGFLRNVEATYEMSKDQIRLPFCYVKSTDWSSVLLCKVKGSSSVLLCKLKGSSSALLCKRFMREHLAHPDWLHLEHFDQCWLTLAKTFRWRHTLL